MAKKKSPRNICIACGAGIEKGWLCPTCEKIHRNLSKNLSNQASGFYRLKREKVNICLAAPEQDVTYCDEGDCRTCLFPISATMMIERWKKEEERKYA